MSAEILEEEFKNLNLNVPPDGVRGKFKKLKSDRDFNLSEILNDIGIVGNINADKLRILSQKDVIGLFFNERGEFLLNRTDLDKILSFNVEQLERIFGDDLHVNALKNQANFQLFLNLIKQYSIERLLSILDSADHSEVNEYSMEIVLQRYDDDTRHLEFMSDDPTLILYLNWDNLDMVGFGMHNYDINVEWVRAALVSDYNGDRGALMEFDRILAELNYYVGDESPDEYEYEEIDY